MTNTISQGGVSFTGDSRFYGDLTIGNRLPLNLLNIIAKSALKRLWWARLAKIINQTIPNKFFLIVPCL